MSRYSAGKQMSFYQNQEASLQATGQAKELVNRIQTEIAIKLTKKAIEPSFRLDITKKQKGNNSELRKRRVMVLVHGTPSIC